MVETRRQFLKRAGYILAAGAAASVVGCEEGDRVRKTEIVEKAVAVGDQPLIPEEFKDKDTHKIVNDEIFTRLGIPPVRKARDELVTEAGIQFSTEKATFQIGRRKQSEFAAEEMGMTYFDHETESYYAIVLLGDEILPFGFTEIIDDTHVLSGEKATNEEAEQLKDDMSEILIKSYNEVIKGNGTVGVHYSYYHFVPKAQLTPTSD